MIDCRNGRMRRGVPNAALCEEVGRRVPAKGGTQPQKKEVCEVVLLRRQEPSSCLGLDPCLRRDTRFERVRFVD